MSLMAFRASWREAGSGGFSLRSIDSWWGDLMDSRFRGNDKGDGGNDKGDGGNDREDWGS